MRNMVWCGVVLAAVAVTAGCSTASRSTHGHSPAVAAPVSTYAPTTPVEAPSATASAIDPSPDPSLTWDDTEPESPVPGATAAGARPTLPPTAARNDDAGATAFAVYYFAVVDHAFLTGDVVPLRETSTATNRTTTDFADRASAMFGEGSRPLGRTQQVVPAGVERRAATTGAVPTVDISLRYSSPAVSIRTRAGDVQTVPPVPERIVTANLIWVSNHWLVDSVSDPAVTAG